jgi:flagellar hook protein FlgE
MQVGTGVYTGSITNDWSQGGINSTGVNTDLYINGNGFFVLGSSNAATTPNYVSQDGTFTVNSSGYLVQANTGMYVMGANTAGIPPTGFGAIKIDSTGYSNPNASITSFTINTQGIITVNMSDGGSFQRAQVQLQNFTDPQALVNMGSNLYNYDPKDAGGLAAPSAVGSGSLTNTTIDSGAVEPS